MGRIDWDGVKAAHPLGATARRTGLAVPDTGRVLVHCPLPGHDDSSPSMQLNLDTNRYRCYGCGAHGDVIQWVQDLEAVTVVEALAILDSGRPITAALARPGSPLTRPEPVGRSPISNAPRPNGSTTLTLPRGTTTPNRRGGELGRSTWLRGASM